MIATALFGELPEFPPALPDDEIKLLGELPNWPTVTAIDEEEHAPCRRLEKRGLVKVRREKDDPIAIRRTWYVGRINKLRLVS